MNVDSEIQLFGKGFVHERGFLVTSALIFIASAAGTVYGCRSMSGGMEMPGGWTMSMAWMRMPGQTWLGAATSFMGMWVVMMIAMMLPSLVPTLLHFRGSVRGPGENQLGILTLLTSGGYFFVWAIFGTVVYPLGLAMTAAEMQWPALARSVPIATAGALLLAGFVQLSAWKARYLWRCREMPACGQSLPPDAWNAWEYGLHLGIRCILCCSGFMLILIATGVMDLIVMAIVTAVITAERLSPRPQYVARTAGVGTFAVGAFLIARTLGVA